MSENVVNSAALAVNDATDYFSKFGNVQWKLGFPSQLFQFIKNPKNSSEINNFSIDKQNQGLKISFLT